MTALYQKIVDRYNRAERSGTVVDVSRITEDGEGMTLIHKPVTDRGLKKQIPGLPIVSDNYEAYAFVMNALGPEYASFGNDYLRQYGSGKGTTVAPSRFPVKTIPPVRTSPIRDYELPANFSSMRTSPIRSVSPTRVSPRLSSLNINSTSPTRVSPRLSSSNITSNINSSPRSSSPRRSNSPRQSSTERPVYATRDVGSSSTRPTQLIDRVNLAQQSGKVLDVSNMDANGKGIRAVNPPTRRSGKIGVSGMPIISNNYPDYSAAMRLLGPEYQQYADEYARLYGTQ